MLITFKPQTVLTLIGPSHSGKSTFAESAKKFLEDSGRTVRILSSDAIRRELLGLAPEQAIPTSDGLAVSEQVFIKIFNDLRTYMAFPILTDVIIIDTTGLDLKFRQDICKTAADANYANMSILFNVEKELLRSRLKEDEQFRSSYIERQVTRLREQVLPRFNKHDYLCNYRLSGKEANITMAFEDTSKVLLGDSGVWISYGDVHQCYQEFQALLQRNAELHPFANHLQVGDWCDKEDENSLKVIINILYNLVIAKKVPNIKLHLLKGNHEEYVYRHLIDPSYVFKECKETEYFTSLRWLTLSENEDYRQRFLALYEASYDFAELRSERYWGIVSHSPCEAKYLGKRSPKALKMMRNTRFVLDGSYESPAIMQMGPIIEEKLPLQHIFGHVEVGKSFHKHNNHIAIDAGCVSGGDLMSYIVDLDTGYRTFESEPSTKDPKPVLDFSVLIKPWSKVAKLDTTQEKKLRRIIKANPAFISSTVSPAPARFLEGNVPDLESTDAAVNLLLRKGVTKVIAQKKHMGSRCQVYLFPNLEDCYAISRNGYRINIKLAEQIIPLLHETYKDKFNTLLILDGELLPWNALGSGLIVGDFKTYGTAIETELKALSKSTIVDHLVGFDLESRLKNIDRFNKQVDIYGADGPVHYEPFGVIYCDGQELITSDLTQTLSRFNIPFVSFDLESPESKEALLDFYEEQVKDGCTEGIVIKPHVWAQGEIPMLKVRNEEYLHLVYGYNYTDLLEKHCHEKDIRGKLHLSIREQELNLHLLNAFKNGLDEDRIEIYKLLIVEFAKESSLDPRL